mmetsp:Transcript_32392/g.77400  ORF Transcript_32392/g.77400 Transcript_32392/m.77400 type:complete len:225 (-) Transcript_32392:105-779(-)
MRRLHLPRRAGPHSTARDRTLPDRAGGTRPRFPGRGVQPGGGAGGVQDRGQESQAVPTGVHFRGVRRHQRGCPHGGWRRCRGVRDRRRLSLRLPGHREPDLRLDGVDHDRKPAGGGCDGADPEEPGPAGGERAARAPRHPRHRHARTGRGGVVGARREGDHHRGGPGAVQGGDQLRRGGAGEAVHGQVPPRTRCVEGGAVRGADRGLHAPLLQGVCGRARRRGR